MAIVSSGVFVGSGNSINVASGVEMYDTVVSATGYYATNAKMYVLEGGSAVRTEIKHGQLIVSAGGRTDSSTINGELAEMIVVSNGSANNTLVKNNGALYASAGAKLTNVNIDSTGSLIMNVTKDNILTGTSHGKSVLVSNGVISNVTIYSGRYMDVASNWTAYDTVVSATGYYATNAKMYVLEGGSAVRTEIKHGQLIVSAGGRTDSSTINGELAEMIVVSNGSANNTLVKNNGALYASAGAKLTNVNIDSTGSLIMNVTKDNILTGTSHGKSVLVSNGVISNVTIYSGRYMDVASNWTAYDTVVSATGYYATNAKMYVLEGGSAVRTEIKHGQLIVNSGARTNSATANGSLTEILVKGAGYASNTTVKNGGKMYVSNGGVAGGSLNIANGGQVIVSAGGKIDFTVKNHTPTADYLVNDLSLITGAPTYTITVSANQSSGTYKLAQNAAALTGALSIGDSSASYGTITVNGADFTHNGIRYSLDSAGGNLTLTVIAPSSIQNLQGNANGISWSGTSSDYVVEYSKDNFANVIRLETETSKVDTYKMPGGTWQYRVKDENAATFPAQNSFSAAAPAGDAAIIFSDSDDDMDLFFARTNGTWTGRNAAKHGGELNGWAGTGEKVNLNGKNIISDVFFGSNDANILVLTDDANGDALFLDDVYTALGNQARLSKIEEIRAGAGDDVIDLTSPKFAYSGDEMTIYGGSGNDVIWASGTDNDLFGDAGNDRIIGSTGFDVITGGAGNDSMNNGGGNDIFAFGANWGNDTVEIVGNANITLWFASGNAGNYNTATRVYRDGSNSVTVTGNGTVSLRFGDNGSDQYDDLVEIGAFNDAASEKIFENVNGGMLA